METRTEDRQRARKILRLLEKSYPNADCTLDFKTPLELLVATVLAAQCTDERVNMVTPTLFRKYSTTKAFAEADLQALQDAIKSTGFFRQKAKSIKSACGTIVEQHGGKVPADMKALTAMRGIGRKTANVVLAAAFGVPGLIVDTHAKRLTHRLGLSRQKTPDRIEMEMMDVVPKEDWTQWSHLLLAHGRAVCTAKKPNCAGCVTNRLCPSAFNV
ncbi:MAG: endonuclease III [Phycisphaerae bacterium]|nr:endonuclease III [Phycisphaerae bacterium]